MEKHVQQTSRPEKMSHFPGNNSFLRQNHYKKKKQSCAAVFILFLFALLCIPVNAEVNFNTSKYQITLNENTGAIISLNDLKSGKTIKGSADLWILDIDKQPGLTSTQFLKAPWNGKCVFSRDKDTFSFAYDSAQIALNVDFIFHEDYIDIKSKILKTDRILLQIILPKLSFSNDSYQKIIFPTYCFDALGIALLPDWFNPIPSENLTQEVRVGGKEYAGLFSKNIKQQSVELSPLKVTSQGRELFSPEAIRFFEENSFQVTRPGNDSDYELKLLATKDGTAVAGTAFGGKGWFFRLAGKNSANKKGSELCLKIFEETMAALARNTPNLFRGKKVAVILVKGNQKNSYGGSVAPRDWETAIPKMDFLKKSGGTFAVIDSPDAMRNALAGNEFSAILNPYGEGFPNGDAKRVTQDIQLLKTFVQKGGIWWETGSYPFYIALEAGKEYRAMGHSYPSATCDLVVVDCGAGSVAMFGVQPVMRRAWDEERLCNPSFVRIGGAPGAAVSSHSWFMFQQPQDKELTFPTYRIKFGFQSPKEAVEEYARALEIKRPLSDKVKNAQKLEQLKGALLVRVARANAKGMLRSIPFYPKGSLVHFAAYLRGGFDKQYPDHLPPNPQWGTMEDLERLYKDNHSAGNMVMPYVNTTWWCDNPRGPTFLAHGESPLKRKRDGSLYTERYAGNYGYTACEYHPAVQKAHRIVMQQMSVQFPSDVVFQDQVGARGWRMDFNPVVPRIVNAREPLLSLCLDDKVPLATESAYDRSTECETIVCGNSWKSVPNTREKLYRDTLPTGAWQFFPTLSFIAHDKCLFTNHNLSHFTDTPDSLVHSLMFGYGLSVMWLPDTESSPVQMAWINWQDALQKSIVREYSGKKLLDFTYPAWQSNRNLIYTKYDGEIAGIFNLGATPASLKEAGKNLLFPERENSEVAKWTLPPYGFYLSAPNVVAGRIYDAKGKIVSFVVNSVPGGNRVTLLSDDISQATFSIPAKSNWKTENFTLEGGKQDQAKLSCLVANGTAAFSFAAPSSTELSMPEYAFNSAPRSRKNCSNIVVVLDADSTLKDGYFNADGKYAGKWYREMRPYSAPKWTAALRSALTGTDLQVVSVNSPEKLVELLSAPAEKRPFAIFNAGGNVFFGPENMTAQQMLKLIKEYVMNGGIWWSDGSSPFFIYWTRNASGKWSSLSIAEFGAGYLGFFCERFIGGEPQLRKNRLKVTAEGRKWLGNTLADKVDKVANSCERPIRLPENPFSLVNAGDCNDVAAVRCGGWGFLFRLAEIEPQFDVATDIIAGTLRYLYNNPWPCPSDSEGLRVWQSK